MNTAQLKTYAPKARTDFIAAVTAQAARLGITKASVAPAEVQGDVLLADGQAFPASIAAARDKLLRRVKDHGFDVTMEAIAYTWFNRFVAIRYMELHGYFDHGFRVLSHPGDKSMPEILDHAAEVELLGLEREKVVALKLDGTRDEELYRMVLIAQCKTLNATMPFLFELVGSESELLLPANLLHTDSLIRELVEAIDENAWDDIEIIGWLYQFYISERKDEVIGKKVKSADIPAATQLFTPNWIVKYMVQNSLGAQWLATYPESPLKAEMDYYIEPAEQTDEVLAQLKAITPDTLNPEELTLIDPACGSGHILVEAYELFKAIYLERGYRRRDVPKLILEKNLFGLDICPRAAQLTSFALMMKGRADDRRLFDGDINLNVMVLQDAPAIDLATLSAGITLVDYDVSPDDITALQELFAHAATFGSLIQVPDAIAQKLPNLRNLVDAPNPQVLAVEPLKRLSVLVRQAEMLAAQYDAVVANPPYMGGKYLVPILKKYLEKHYTDYRKDLFAAFIDRDLAFSKDHGHLGFMSPFVWMFISSYEDLRKRLISEETITSLIQLEYSGFDGATVPICTFTLQKGFISKQKGSYIRLSDFRGPKNQAPKTLEAIHDHSCGWFFEIDQDEFKKIPGSPVAYWVSDIVPAFESEPALSSLMTLKAGMSTGNNDLFQRYWHEISYGKLTFSYPDQPNKWVPCNSGGRFRKWFGNNRTVVNWEDSGTAMRTYRNAAGKIGSAIRNEDYYFLPGITWTKISSGRFTARWMDEGFVFDDTGRSGFVINNSVRRENILAAILSNFSHAAFGVLTPTLSVTSGELSKIPVPCINDNEIRDHAEKSIELSRWDWNLYERSWDFSCAAILENKSATLNQSFNRLVEISQNKTRS